MKNDLKGVILVNIRISTQNALIGIDTTNGQFSIRQNQWPMKVSSTQGKLYLETEDPVLLIDQRQCFAEAGLKSSIDLSREGAAKGRAAALRATARIASEGKEMADVHKGRAIPRQAARRLRKNPQVNFDMIPKSRPDIKVIKGEVRGAFQKGEVNVRTDNIKPDIYYQRGNLNIYLKQKSDIKIDYLGNNLDVYGG